MRKTPPTHTASQPAIISAMRINLVTPFAEKDAAKALGARWDTTRKVWYIVDVEDLTPFLRWIQNAEDGAETLQALSQSKSKPAKKAKAASRSSADVPVTTLPAMAVAHCGCAALPWEDCIHTRSG